MSAWTWNPATGTYDPAPGTTTALPSAVAASAANVWGSTASKPTTLGQNGAPSPSSPTPTNNLDPATSSAWAMLESQLDAWGLGSLAATGKQYLIEGYTLDSIPTLLQSTPEFKARFSGNDARIKAGLAPLSPAEYLATERSYKQVLSQYGIPGGFWDSQSEMATLIGNDMSPDELKTRAQDAQTVWLSTDPNVKQAWSQMYGLSDGAGIAAILDPKTALPVVQRMTTASQIGGAAVQNGMGVDRSRFEQYADLGVTQAQAQKAFGQLGQDFGTERQLASRFGTSWSQAQAEQADLGLSGQAVAKQAQMYDAEKALFGARGSADQNTNSTRASGSY